MPFSFDACDEMHCAIGVEHVIGQHEHTVLRGGDDAEDAAAAVADGGDLGVVPAVIVDAHDLTGRGESGEERRGRNARGARARGELPNVHDFVDALAGR